MLKTTVFYRMALILTWALFVGFALFYRDFSKIRIYGPVYLSEAMVVVALACLSVSAGWRTFLKWGARFLKTNALLLGLFAWATGHLFIDLYYVDLSTMVGQEKILTRILQHYAFFIYIIQYVFFGYILAHLYSVSSLRRLFTFAVAIQVVVFFFQFVFMQPTAMFIDADIDQKLPWTILTNLSLGPLAFYYFEGVVHQKHRPLSRVRLYSRLFGWFLLSAGPFVVMWFTHLKRVVLVQLVFSSILIPTLRLLSKERLTIVPSLKAIVGWWIVTLTIVLVVSYYQFSGSSDPIKESALSALQHGEDKPLHNQPDNQYFQARFRRFIWKQTIEDWAGSTKTILVGQGMVPEVPSKIRDDRPNNGEFANDPDPNLVTLNGKPINGPHNSYLTLLARTGLLGLALFLTWFLPGVWRFFTRWRVLNNNTDIDRSDLEFYQLLLFVLSNGALYAAFQIAFESNYVVFFFWLSFGILNALPNNIVGLTNKSTPGFH